MWGKVSFHRSRKPVIVTPELVKESSVDNVCQSSGSGARTAEKLPKGLPFVPQYSSDSTFSANRSDSGHRVTSSIYSRDTFDHSRQRSVTWDHQNDGRFYQDPETASEILSVEISPPDSPMSIGRTYHSRGSSRVSSLEFESNQTSNGEHNITKLASHLPIPRKRARSAQPDNRPSTQGLSGQNRTARWDGFSDAPTTSHSDKFAPNLSTDISFGSQHTGSSNASRWIKGPGHSKEQNTEGRQRSPSKNDNPFSLAVREPWKGPSGRSAMINPIQEKPRERSSSRVHQSKNNDHNNRSKESDRASPDYSYLGFAPSVVTTITGGADNTLGPDRRQPSKSRQQPSIAKKPITSISATSDVPPRIEIPGSTLEATLAELKLSTGDQAHAPVSRFSATTCATTESDSPTPSRRESVDAASQSTENAPSIMSRKRPIPSAMAPGKKPTRKPTPSQADNGKDLPPCPPEQQAQNRIEMLEARRDTLARRRANINTIIHELTQVIQPSSIAYDIAARDEVKKTVTSLNNELADIKREEHEIGMKLFRLWKKRDEQDLYGGDSGLWVKRVTS
ncbi:uncharacterized protein NFIA_066780 [Aspergillus fischeri NRRL 181]|uniref:BHLH domain-containing protein n=1 Tax=Neosartorya fischeri (strain ATCC 1020 / DSM 3700 / CBS 544.65 / FGSC A1164 / JCM 1740 / NRRL 181 / WB 181) TaxID=331117 RepID=A1D717_NEOFI|nr:conserved hypothetical protein [Aspergillus fischeri NRRL 181]EAW21511.1 conserved hypothetical protein [Aspergillus fischeri NRRL 181]